ncbi:MAG TPA: PIG-L deacetylase family protein [Dehalococcoidia bacterium]|jgi:LmbE family N-acetylglucosaminyl deacetylase
MERTLRLMCILAHPDDETLGFGGTLVRYASEGVETSVITATRGEKGWFGEAAAYPGPDELGKTRETELRASVAVMGVRDLTLLDYIDGDLDAADARVIVRSLAGHIRRLKPDVVLTFAHDGFYGHPDHIAISQFATAAVHAAADQAFDAAGDPHAVSKLYYRVPSDAYLKAYEAAFGDLVMHIDGEERRGVAWPDWAITTSIPCRAHWRRVLEAVRCHRTQLPGYETLMKLPEAHHEYMWGTQEYYRVLSLVSGGRARETDLFEGLRQEG